MNQKEWIAYFEAVNNRKPTPKELNDALAAGLIQTPKNRKRYVYMGVGFLLLVALALVFFLVLPKGKNELTTASPSSVASTSSVGTTSADASRSSATTADAVAVTSNQMDIAEIMKHDISSIQGNWVSESGETLAVNTLSLKKLEIEDGYIINKPIKMLAGMNSDYFIPSGSEGPSLQSTLLGYSYKTNPGFDRIALSKGLDFVVYYRDSDIDAVRNSDYSFEFLVDINKLIHKYRSDVNESLQYRKDYISGNFLSGSQSYAETRDYIINQSAKDKIERYESRTKSITNINYNGGDHASFTVEFTTKTYYTDGRSPSEQENTRDYVVERQNGSWYISSF